MSEIDDGGPAFPRPIVSTGTGRSTQAQEGMSLRDWFAGQVIMGMAASPNTKAGSEEAITLLIEAMAQNAYRTADAMLKARKAPGTTVR